MNIRRVILGIFINPSIKKVKYLLGKWNIASYTQGYQGKCYWFFLIQIDFYYNIQSTFVSSLNPLSASVALP